MGSMPDNEIKTEAAIGFGSNLGERMSHLREALARLRELDSVALLCKSGVYETEPVDVLEEFADMPFLNAVAVFETSLGVEEWSAVVHAIEDAMLRVRGTVPHTPRTIDLDLLYFGDMVINRPHLHIPHPQISLRRFVCEPLAELRPDMTLPGQYKTIRQILATLPTEPAVRRVGEFA